MRFEISHPDKIIFPESKIKKINIINYYEQISPLLLPILKNRPLTQVRCPEGIERECFYQKHIPSFYPQWIEYITAENSDGSLVNYINCINQETLLFIANQGCITLHPWLSKLPHINNPDKIIFDLDPSGKDFTLVKEVALIIKDMLEKENLKPFVMTTGSKGLHIIAPITPEHNFSIVKAFTKNIAETVVKNHPEITTLEFYKEKREKKVFIDYLRNEWGATSVAPYSIRTLEYAPIAMPIDWKELKDSSLTPDKYNIKNIFTHIEKDNPQNNPWHNFEKSRVKLKI